MHDGTIQRLREALPPLLTVAQYCKLMNRCQASAYHDLKNKPGIAVKVGGSTRFVTDVVLDEMRRLPNWTPQKERLGASKYHSAKVVAPKKSRLKKIAAPRREPDVEVRP